MGTTRTPRRIAIFTNDDPVWSLHAWTHAIPELNREDDIVGIYLFPSRLKNLRGWSIPLWYLRTFGIRDFLLLGAFAVKRIIELHGTAHSSWKKLAQGHGIELRRGKSPNDPEVVHWTRDNHIDIVFIMVGEILKKEILQTPLIGIINMHAAMVPHCRGLFPYLWSKLTEAPVGVTFHRVEKGIDTGKILLQAKHTRQDPVMSMLRFSIDVYAAFPRMAKLALNRMIADSYSREEEAPMRHDSSNYYSAPTTADVAAYRGRSFQTASIADLLYSPSGKCFEFTINPELYPDTVDTWGERRTAQRLERIARPKEGQAVEHSLE